MHDPTPLPARSSRAQELLQPADSAFPGVEPVDLRIADGSVAQDAGEPIAGFGFGGAAPDLGAYEVGDELPVYGPRE